MAAPAIAVVAVHHFSAQEIAQGLGRQWPALNIENNWPLVVAALVKRGIDSTACEIAAAATIAVDAPAFKPVKERGGPAYLKKLYWGNQAAAQLLGNTHESDALNYCAQGYVPIRGRANYAHYGRLIGAGADLEAEPSLALNPHIAAEILAAYFWERKINELAEHNQWELVRRRVNGGLNHWGSFKQYVAGLGRIAGRTARPAGVTA